MYSCIIVIRSVSTIRNAFFPARPTHFCSLSLFLPQNPGRVPSVILPQSGVCCRCIFCCSENDAKSIVFFYDHGRSFLHNFALRGFFYKMFLTISPCWACLTLFLTISQCGACEHNVSYNFALQCIFQTVFLTISFCCAFFPTLFLTAFALHCIF